MIDPSIRNSVLIFCIDEYVRKKEHREILKEKWFDGLTIMELAERHNMSETAVKNVLYGIGDDILLRAVKMSEKPD